MSGPQIRAGKAVVEVGIVSRVRQGAATVQRDLDMLSRSVTAIGLTIAAGSAALLAVPVREGAKLQETLSRFNVVFGEASGVVLKWANTTADAMGMSREATLSTVANFQNLLTTYGLMPSAAAGMSKSLTTLAADLASFHNMRIEDVVTNLFAAMTNEGQVMAKYGVILNEATIKQELYNMGKDPQTTDASARAAARYNIILAGTVSAQGDVIRTAGSFTNQLKFLFAAAVNASGAIGGAFIDDTAALIRVALDATNGITHFITTNTDLVRVLGLSVVAVGATGVSLIALGAAAKLAALTMGVIGTAGSFAAGVLGTAWSMAAALISTTYSLVTAVLSGQAAAVAAAWLASALAVSGGWAVAGLAMITSATTFSGILAGLAALTGAAWAAAWAVVTGPIAVATALITGLVLSVGGALLGAAAAVGAVFVALTAYSLDYAEIFRKGSEMVSNSIKVILDVFDTIKMALAGGDYEAAATALWAGLRLIFWEGVQGTLSAINWFGVEAMMFLHRLFDNMVEGTVAAMEAVVDAIMHPFKTGMKVVAVVDASVAGASPSAYKGRAEMARKDLTALRDQLKDNQAAAAKIREEALSTEDRLALDLADIDAREKSGSLSKEEALKERKAADKSGAAYEDARRAIELTTLAAVEGEAAADAARRAEDGLTPLQVAKLARMEQELALWQELKKSTDAAAAQESVKKQDRTLATIEKSAKRAAGQGVDPTQIFRSVNDDINRAEGAGDLSKEQAADARIRAQDSLDHAIAALQEDGHRLSLAMRTSAEVLRDDKARVQMQFDNQVISKDTLDRAMLSLQSNFDAEVERQTKASAKIDEDLTAEQSSVGPRATFSAFAAGIIGRGGQNFERDQLKVAQEIAKNTAFLARQAKKNPVAVFK